MENEHTRKTQLGFKWSFIDQLSRQIVTVGLSVVLSRLILPSEFGMLAMVAIIVGFLQVIREAGLGASVIHKKNISEVELSTIFWLNVVVGTFLAIILFCCAPVIALFFEQPLLTNIVRLLSVTFIFSSIAVVPDALIQKVLDFKKFFYRNLIVILLSGVLGIILGYYGFGVWALVAQQFATAVLGSIVSLYLVNWKPKLIFRKSVLGEHLKFSLPILGDNTFNYWVRNIDSLLVGKMLGPGSLGIYNRAYSLMLLPIRQISATFTRVVFPSFTLIQDDKEEIWNKYTRLISIIATVTFPLMLLLGVFAEELILLLYGSAWVQVIPIFKILCVLGALQSIGTLSGAIYSAIGKTLLMFKVGLVSKAILIVSLITGLYIGQIQGMVWGYLAASSVGFMIESYYISISLKNNLWNHIKSYIKEVLVSFIAVVPVFVIRIYYPYYFDSFESILFNTIGILIFILILFILLRKLNATGIMYLLQKIKKK